jgi:hypothetical protein
VSPLDQAGRARPLSRDRGRYSISLLSSEGPGAPKDWSPVIERGRVVSRARSTGPLAGWHQRAAIRPARTFRYSRLMATGVPTDLMPVVGGMAQRAASALVAFDGARVRCA